MFNLFCSFIQQRVNRVRRGSRYLLFAISCVAGLSSVDGHAAGLMRAVGDSGAELAIRDHRVDVQIEDGYAVTTVEQVFSNSSQQDGEAIYHFPVPAKAAVSEFTVWIDGQPVVGEVFEKQQARQIYNEEKAAGRETGLTEKNKHYNFEIRVSPVRASQDTRVRLVYMQPIEIDTGIGRYVYPLKDGQTDSQALAFWQSDTRVQGTFSFDLNLRSSYPVVAARLPAHPRAVINQLSGQEWNVSLVNAAAQSVSGTGDVASAQVGREAAALVDLSGSNTASQQQITGFADSEDRTNATAATQPASVIRLDNDIVFYWRLDDNAPAAIDLVAHKAPGKDTGTFMMTITPGDDLARITEGRDWVFVLDQSGSMKGKYATLTDGISRALGQLSSQDRFRIIGFNNSAREITDGWQQVSQQSIERWSRAVLNSKPGGGTNLYAGTERGLKALDSDRTSAIVLVTDGEANVGTVEKKQFLELMKRYDVRLFTAVMGNGANRPLLKAMTKVSNGFAMNVSDNDDIVGALMQFTSKATHKSLHNLQLDIKGVEVSSVTPAKLPSLYRGQQLTVMGKYRQGGVIDVSLSGRVSGEKRTYTSQFELPQTDERNPEVERLWAFASISDMKNAVDYLGDDSEYRQAITDMAVNHGLVTDYTSMVVLREEQFAARGIERSNRDRRNRETTAANQRAAQPVANTRVDQHQPAFSTGRANHSGSGNSGSGSASWLLLISGLLMLVCRRFTQALRR